MAAYTAAAMALAGAAAAAKNAHDKQKDSARRENMNRQLGALDTAYGSLVKSQTGKVQETDPGAGVLGGALTGGLAGAQTGMNINSASQAKELNDAKIANLKKGGTGGGNDYGLVAGGVDPGLGGSYQFTTQAQMDDMERMKQAIGGNNAWMLAKK